MKDGLPTPGYRPFETGLPLGELGGRSECFDDLFTRTMGQRHARKHGVHRGTAGENSSVGDVEIVHIVATAELINHSQARIAVHARRAEGVVASAHQISCSDGMTLQHARFVEACGECGRAHGNLSAERDRPN